MPSIDHNCAEHPSAILWHCVFIQCTSSRSLKVFCVSVCERSVFSVRQGGKRWGLLQAPWLHPAEPAGDPWLVTKQGNFCQSELCILVCLGFVCVSKFFMDMMFFGICVVQLPGLGSGVCTSRLYRAPTRLCPLSFCCWASPRTDRYNAGVTAFLFLSVFANGFWDTRHLVSRFQLPVKNHFIPTANLQTSLSRSWNNPVFSSWKRGLWFLWVKMDIWFCVWARTSANLRWFPKPWTSPAPLRGSL